MERARRSILVLANPAPSQTTAMFRRKNSSGDGSCRRRVERHVPEDYNQFRVFLEPPEGEQNHGQVDGGLVVQIDSQIEDPIQGRLADLSFHGVCVVLSLNRFPAITEGEVVGVRIEHVSDGWRVVTPGMVRAIEIVGGCWVRIGLEFVNLGSLASQIKHDHGKYFNRRRVERASVVDELEATLKQKGKKVSARICDLSICGVGGTIDHVAASELRVGENVTVSISLPKSRRSVSGPADLVYKIRSEGDDQFGLSFDLTDWVPNQAKQLRSLVDEYLSTRFLWSA